MATETDLLRSIRGAPSAAALEAIGATEDVNALNASGDSPLVAAASAGRLDLVDALLAKGASADAQTESGMSALASAAMNGHLSCTSKLLEAGATVDLPCGRSETTALVYAARNGHRACCEALYEAGADPQLADAYGESAEAAAWKFESTGRKYAGEFAAWESAISDRAAAIAAEPPEPPSLYPLRLREDVTRYHRSADPTKMLWRPGAWMHQVRGATEAVERVARPRKFSATGYNVQEARVAQEHSVLPAEVLSESAALKAMQGPANAPTIAAGVALERTARNPQLFNDDVPLTAAALRSTVTLAHGAFENIKAHEAKMAADFPEVPTHIGKAPVYSSGLQRAAMSVPSAAASLVPMLEAPPDGSLTALLSRGKKAVEAAEEAAEPEEEAPTGKKK